MAKQKREQNFPYQPDGFLLSIDSVKSTYNDNSETSPKVVLSIDKTYLSQFKQNAEHFITDENTEKLATILKETFNYLTSLTNTDLEFVICFSKLTGIDLNIYLDSSEEAAFEVVISLTNSQLSFKIVPNCMGRGKEQKKMLCNTLLHIINMGINKRREYYCSQINTNFSRFFSKKFQHDDINQKILEFVCGPQSNQKK